MRRGLPAYAVVIGALAAAVVLRWLLDPLLGDSVPFITLFGAVAIAVWLGGPTVAILVAFAGYIACNYFFIAPRYTLGPLDPKTLVGLAAYVFTCTLIIVIGEAMRRAQSQASEHARLQRVTLASIADAVITADTQGRVTYVNAVAETLTGWQNSEAAGQPLDTVFRIVDETVRRPVESSMTRAIREGALATSSPQTILIHKDGTERPIDESAAPIRDDYGRVIGSVLIFRDVSERRRWERDEAERLMSVRLLASIVESSDDAIISKTLDGTIRTWNAGAERLFGYSAGEALGQHISLIIPPERAAEEEHIVSRLKAGRRIDHFESVRVRKDGHPVFVSLTISPIRDAAGNIVGASKIALDITERRQAEAERQKFVTLVENSTDFIGMCDVEGIPFYINPAGLRMVGLDSIADSQRVHVGDFFFAEDRSRVMDEMFPAVVEKGHAEAEIRFRNFRTNEARWMLYKVLRINDPDGRTVAYATVSQDISERRRLEDGLRTLAANLSEEDRRKNEFLATLSHELRNPLAPLRNMLEVLKRGDGDSHVRARAIDIMQRQLGQLIRLVDDLLDLNRITHDRLDLRRGRVDIALVIEHAIESCRPLAEAVNHDVRANVPSERIYVNGDEARLTQVLANLVNNSCKYTNPGGKIDVIARREGNDAVVTVRDSGIGIPANKLQLIFDMFMQVERSAERSQGGLGIGLTLVKRLVEMHGGTIEAWSAGEGSGSEFTVRLPIMLEEGDEEIGHQAGEPELPMSSRRVLVVDDNEDAGASLVMLLQIAGHETSMAHDGLAAMEAMELLRPDLVLLDIGLPVLNGYEVCRRVRQQPWGKEIKVIALTGWGQEKDRKESREAGFDGHLVKPVDYGALTSLLASGLATRTEP